jgi:hypothetical protein
VIKAGGIDEKGEFIDGPEIAKYRWSVAKCFNHRNQVIVRWMHQLKWNIRV